jgi:putative oxidoreductase
MERGNGLANCNLYYYIYGDGNIKGERFTMLNGIIPTAWQPQLHALLRVIMGLMLLQHGTSKILHFPINNEILGMYAQMGGLATFTGIVELIGGILIIIGAFTRVTSFILSGYMAVAFWMVHFGMSHTIIPMINQGETVVFFCFIFLYFAAAGAGPYSLDASRGQ